MIDTYESKRLIKYMQHEAMKKLNCLPCDYEEGYASGFEDAVITMINWIKCYEGVEKDERKSEINVHKG